ncbi:TRAF family member-associated NF-kappa-B activator isoform X2 [Kryptolebias marmoratus]|uniref:TRAF family member-associated NF-kappa-B activator isoform X2 n=1 Tax=Kryptolebias marmoratus TaxID=37003 RepID=UPI000D52F80F|nr:TRAF family member-associated NF-kappa-B activator isoform X2 [Kryptolebias marmoratus]
MKERFSVEAPVTQLTSSPRRAHVCRVSDGRGAQGMEKNIGDQLNKAFEAYRQASIEKDNAQKELKKMTEYYERYTQELQKQIEDQQKLISELEAKLSAANQASEVKCEPCNHLHEGPGTYRKVQFPENMGTVAVAPNLPVSGGVDYQGMLMAFEAIQGKFRQIQNLTRRQKEQLKRFHGGCEASNDQRFSMPIQCTDRTAEAERPFPSALRPAVDVPHLPASLASRGTTQEDRDFVDSLTKLSVKFPPPADSEYEFLNSAPDRNLNLVMPLKQPLSSASPALTEEKPVERPILFVYPTSPSHSTSSSPSQESVRGPQQSFWSPGLCEAADTGTDQEPLSSSPNKCAFCNAVVPQNRMNSHLYSHCSPKNEASN